jgi:hypothetical protein
MTIVLDAGAIIASERNDRVLTAIVASARKRRNAIVAPASVIAQTWRGPSTHPLAAKFVGSIDMFPDLDVEVARRIGALLQRSKTADIVDGNVAEIAIGMRPSMIVTSDQSDVARLLSAANISHAMFGAHKRQDDVIIFPI